MIDTATFQRLRHLKQLGLGHITYPNATHTRFAHSLGVLAIMHRLIDAAKRNELGLTIEEEEDIRLAGLLHDIGHYPYSHLMEHVDRVVLTEERRASSRNAKLLHGIPYPKHTKLGELIVTRQDDIRRVLGDDRVRRVAKLFTGESKNKKLVKFISSSLDMDRLDYLMRDSRAAGVPFGVIDLNYLLNNLRVSRTGAVGITHKAICAAEHFLYARYFMYRTVYYHKATYALEEAMRQLIRRCRPNRRYELPADGVAVRRTVTSKRSLAVFTDSYLDRLAQHALTDGTDPVIRDLAKSIVFRQPPKLLREVVSLVYDDDPETIKKNEATRFLSDCDPKKINSLEKKFGKRSGHFLITQLPGPLRLESVSNVNSADESGDSADEKREEVIQVFAPSEAEPKPLSEVYSSMAYRASRLNCFISRLYVVEEDADKVEKMKQAVSTW